MKIRGNILCSGELGGLCCQWNVYHQNLEFSDLGTKIEDALTILPHLRLMIDEMKHLKGA